jgi:tetratricopeptide (TPR) repeat protein
VSNAYSRWREREADRFSLKAVGVAGFIPAMEKLAELNLADPKPHAVIEWWFYTHPPIEKRIRMAKSFLSSFVLIFALSFLPAGFSEEVPSDREKAKKELEKQARTEVLSYFVGDPKNAAGIKTPVAIEFHNQAVEFYEKKEYELARQAAQDSLAYNPRNPFAFELLGDIAYVEQKLDEALGHYEAAFRIRAGEDLKNKILKVRKERQVESGLETFEGEKFVIKYKGEERGLEGYELREILRAAYRAIGQEFGYFFRHTVVVLLYDTEEFHELSGVPHWSEGIYDGKIRLPAYQKGFTQRDIEKIIRHELTHTFIAEMSQNRCPLWLTEGLAEYQEAKVEPKDLRVFEAAVRTNTLYPLEILFSKGQATAMKDPLEVVLFYDQSYHWVKHLVERYGMFRVKQIVEAFAKGKDSFEAIEEVLGIPLAQVEKQWKESFPSS